MRAYKLPGAFRSTETLGVLVGKLVGHAVCLSAVRRTCLAILLRSRVLLTDRDLLRLLALCHATTGIQTLRISRNRPHESCREGHSTSYTGPTLVVKLCHRQQLCCCVIGCDVYDNAPSLCRVTARSSKHAYKAKPRAKAHDDILAFCLRLGSRLKLDGWQSGLL